MMTWFLRMALMLMPVTGWAEVPPVPQVQVPPNETVGAIRLEVTLTPGLGVGASNAHLILGGTDGRADPSGTGLRFQPVPLVVARAERRGSKVTYWFRIPERGWDQAHAFGQYHSMPYFQPAISLCRNPGTGLDERLSYRLHRPGHSATPFQQVDPSAMGRMVPTLRPCPPPAEAS